VPLDNSGNCRLRVKSVLGLAGQIKLVFFVCLCGAVASFGLVAPRTRFQLTLAHDALVMFRDTPYLILKFGTVLWQQFDHDIGPSRHAGAR
jgi:hypothetical protein